MATISHDQAPCRTIVLIAGAKSHGPEGNGVHDYARDAHAAASMLQASELGPRLEVEVVVAGWPAAELLARAHAIVLFCDGRDGDRFSEALHLQDDQRVRDVAMLMARGCGLAVIHFGIFAPERLAAQALDWCGGYFQWQGEDGSRAWRSSITTIEGPVELAAPGHPVLHGVVPFRLQEEFYHNLRFAPAGSGWTPLLRVPALHATREHGTVVAWAQERSDGGRGFGTSLGHFHANWKHPDYRTVLLNGICWVASIEIPPQGVLAACPRPKLAAAPIERMASSAGMRVLLLSGNAAHQWHHWQRTAPEIVSALERDDRVTVDSVTDPEAFATRDLKRYDLIVLNYCNWQDPVGMSAQGRNALATRIGEGGGLLVVHFANGAFHHSLPGAEASDWPEYRRLVRRIWAHDQAADGASTHDAYGPFIARPCGDHPIVAGLAAFTLEDELYVRQRGDEPLAPLLCARSQVTAADEPLAWAYAYGEGRVFQTLLGHSERTYEAFAAREMLRRAASWCARRELRPLDSADDLRHPCVVST